MNLSSESDCEPPGGSPWNIEFNLEDLALPTQSGPTQSGSEDSSAGDDLDIAWETWQHQLAASARVDLPLLENAISQTLALHELQSAEISVAIVSGPTMRRLNQQYLDHDFDTDVLSFCLSEPEDEKLLAQLIVSIDYAKQQAETLSSHAKQAISANDELCLYLVHGTLHTLGYDDHEEQDRAEMRQAERDVLARMNMVPYWPSTSEDAAGGGS